MPTRLSILQSSPWPLFLKKEERGEDARGGKAVSSGIYASQNKHKQMRMSNNNRNKESCCASEQWYIPQQDQPDGMMA